MGTILKIGLGIALGGLILIVGCSALLAGGVEEFERGLNEAEQGLEPGGSGEKPRGRARTLRFSGDGGKNVGTIRLPKDSRLTWTNTGDLFSVQDEDFGLSVNSQGKRGTSEVEAGTYRKVEVNALGDWTMTIKPK